MMAGEKIRAGLRKSKQGLPMEAFAIVGHPGNPDTWKLPHHTRAIFRALMGKSDIEATVDWGRTPAAVATLSPGGYRGQHVNATPWEVLQAANHLASHYLKAGRDLPTTLAALVGQ